MTLTVRLSCFLLFIQLLYHFLQKGETVKKMREEVKHWLHILSVTHHFWAMHLSAEWGWYNCVFVFSERCSHQHIRGIIPREDHNHHGSHRGNLQSFRHDCAEVWGGSPKQIYLVFVEKHDSEMLFLFCRISARRCQTAVWRASRPWHCAWFSQGASVAPWLAKEVPKSKRSER